MVVRDFHKFKDISLNVYNNEAFENSFIDKNTIKYISRDVQHNCSLTPTDDAFVETKLDDQIDIEFANEIVNFNKCNKEILKRTNQNSN